MPKQKSSHSERAKASGSKSDSVGKPYPPTATTPRNKKEEKVNNKKELDENTIEYEENEEINAKQQSTNKVFKTFEDMGLKDDLLRGIYQSGFQYPSSIQQRAIVPIIKGRDIIAQSQSGTGKTATFSIATLQKINIATVQPQCLIISPTRELALQTEKVLLKLGDYLNIKVNSFIGGNPLKEDLQKLQSGVHVISGTPGRILELIEKKFLSVKTIKMLIIDEADEMLKIGFKEQIYSIYRNLDSNIQIVLISATLPTEVLEVAENLMTTPIKILLKRDEVTLDAIKQFFIAVEKEDWKFETLCDLYDSLTITQCVIFCNTRDKVEWLAKEMKKNNFTISFMHGSMSQKERIQIVDEFRNGKSRVLITTDIWARGIDIPQISLVINYDLPVNRENYVHRIGRSGRYGRKGVAINFVTNQDVGILRDIEQFYGTVIEEMPAKIDEYL
ncbi:hypothetical protein ABK040_011501 [Willaertia magna]